MKIKYCHILHLTPNPLKGALVLCIIAALKSTLELVPIFREDLGVITGYNQ